MRPNRRRIATVLLFVLLASPLAFPTHSASAATCWNPTDLEQRFAGKINLKRADSGVSKLTLDPELSKVARTHSKEMKRRGTAFHSSTQTLASRVTNWTTLAENVGEGQTVSEVWRALLDGAQHESNTVDSRFTFMGVGVVTDGAMKYVTIVFEGSRNPGTTLSMPSC